MLQVKFTFLPVVSSVVGYICNSRMQVKTDVWDPAVRITFREKCPLNCGLVDGYRMLNGKTEIFSVFQFHSSYFCPHVFMALCVCVISSFGV